MGTLPVYKDSFFCGLTRPDGLQLRMVYEKAAEIRGVQFASFAAAMETNAARLFGWGGEPAEEERTC